MANTKTLKTGNAAATKPGKALTFVVTQEAFDAAFHAGRAVAGAFHAAAEALAPMLTPLAGSSDARHIAQWNEFRRAFSLGMAAERNVDPDSARRMFGRIVDFLGLDKPQSEEAKRKQAARAAAKPTEPAGDEESPVDGEAAAQAVQMALSQMEAHLVSMLRAGKFAQAAQCVADMAEAAK
jgi:hypothetical protein